MSTALPETKRLASLIGKKGLLEIHHKDRGSQEPISIRVKIINSKVAYGHARVLVKPERGEGEWWVDLGKVTLNGEET